MTRANEFPNNVFVTRCGAALHGRFRLAPEAPHFDHAGQIRRPTVVFPRDPVVIEREDAPRALADVNSVMLYSGAVGYRRHRFGEGGDRSEWYAVSEETAEEMTASLGGTGGWREAIAAGRVAADPALIARQRRLSRRLSLGQVGELEAEEEVLGVVHETLERALLAAGAAPPRARESTRRAHRRLAERARGALVERLGERVTLGEIATCVHASPYHLARVFRAQTGQSVHEYLTRLRLARSLDELERGAPLAGIAAGCGFCSQSHYGSAFRRRFGVSPDVWRRTIRGD